MGSVLWGERDSRRRVLVGLLAVFALVDAALGFAFLRWNEGAAAQPIQPLHPVVGQFRPDGTELTECADAGCFQQAFGNVAFREGPKAALALVDDVYGSGADPACHGVTHIIGAASLARFRGNVTRTLAAGAPTCWSGYYHGVLERSLVKAKTRQPDGLAAVARGLCVGERMSPWVLYGCLHGLGHGLMIATGLNLPVSLEVCSRLGRWWDRDACRGGAFMENIQSSYGFRSTFLDDDDPVYPCNQVALGTKRRCYQVVTTRILPLVSDDWERTAEICAGVEKRFVSWCFRSFGRDASSRSNRDATRIAELCAVARPYGAEGYCVEAAAYDITANFASAEEALPLCDAVHVGVRGYCYYGVGTVTARFRTTDAARVADCEALAGDSGYVAECLRGGRENLPRG
jgi:hypothetical protein